MKTDTLFAHLTPRGLEHFFPSARAVKMCGDFPIVQVNLTEVEAGDHWAWWDAERGRFSMVYRSRGLLDMCSPDGFEHATAIGRGKVMRVRVDIIG